MTVVKILVDKPEPISAEIVFKGGMHLLLKFKDNKALRDFVNVNNVDEWHVVTSDHGLWTAGASCRSARTKSRVSAESCR